MAKTGVEFQPTKQNRQDVITMRHAGWQRHRIARVLGLTIPTLMKHFIEEMEIGQDIRALDIRRAMTDAALSGNVTACKWLEQRSELTAPRQDAAPKEPALGKKERAIVDAAEAAGADTDWSGLLPN